MLVFLFLLAHTQCVCLYVCIHIYLSVCLSVCLSGWLAGWLAVCQSVSSVGVLVSVMRFSTLFVLLLSLSIDILGLESISKIWSLFLTHTHKHAHPYTFQGVESLLLGEDYIRSSIHSFTHRVKEKERDSTLCMFFYFHQVFLS
jgi:hypothetical protein